MLSGSGLAVQRLAAFGFTMSSVEDFNFLSEFKSYFKGFSNVTRLALSVRFDYAISDKRTWWGLPREQEKEWIGGNKKTEAIWNLLQVTKELSSLELSINKNQFRNVGDNTELHPSCLSSLHQSFNSAPSNISHHS